MTNILLLRQAIEESGMKIVIVAERVGISKSRMYCILRGAECKASEISGFAEVLRLSKKQRDDIFLSSDVNVVNDGV